MSDNERDEAFGDAVYFAWLAGLNPDDVRRESIDDHFDAGALDRFHAADMEVQRLHRRRH